MAAPDQFPIVLHGDGVACSRSHSQCLGSLCCEMRVAPQDACFAPGRRVQRCLGRVARRRRAIALWCGYLNKRRVSFCPASPGFLLGRRIPATKGPETNAAGRVHHVVCSVHHLSSLPNCTPAHVRTASHSPRQPALVNLSPSQHFCCFLCVTRGDIKPGEDAKERRGWRTRAHRTAVRSRQGGERYLRTPLRRYTGALPAKNWPGRVAPPDTFRGKISPARRERPRRGQPAIHTSTPPDPKARRISAPNTQLTSAPRRSQKQR